MNNQQFLQQAQQNSGRSMQGKSEDNPMNVDANAIFEDYKKEVADLEWALKVKNQQIKNFQELTNKLKSKNIELLNKIAKVEQSSSEKTTEFKNNKKSKK